LIIYRKFYFRIKKDKTIISKTNPNKEDILLLPKKKEKSDLLVNTEINAFLKQKIIDEIKNSFLKLDKIFLKRFQISKFKILNHFKIKFALWSKKKNVSKNNIKSQEIMCGECKEIIIENGKCNKCKRYKKNFSIREKEDKLDKNKINIEDYFLIKHEKTLLNQKIKNNLISILKIFNERHKYLIKKFFLNWFNMIKYEKFCSSLKTENEKKYANKFETKIQENSKQIRKLDKEKIEITIKNESLIQTIQVNTLKINTFKDKEKNLNSKIKNLNNEKKMFLFEIQKSVADIDNKISNLENNIKDLEAKLLHLNEIKNEKNEYMNKYIDEMNDVLDYFEKKTSNNYKIKGNKKFSNQFIKYKNVILFNIA